MDRKNINRDVIRLNIALGSRGEFHFSEIIEELYDIGTVRDVYEV